MSQGLVLFSGGGTVGHLAPGFALAEQLETLGYETRFATPGEAAEAEWFAEDAKPLVVPASRLPRGAKQMLTFGPRLLRQIRGARRVLRQLSPNLLVALGGWPCVPMLMAARRAKVPVALVVADAVPGLVVRRLWKRAGLLLLQDPRAADGLPPSAPTLATGPLLRASLTSAKRDRTAFDLDAELPTLLVTGGSLGARGLYTRWLDGLVANLDAGRHDASRFQVLHAAGSETDIAKRYERMGVRAHVRPFFCDMGAAYAAADLVLGRAGAGTCVELAALRKPSFLVPYPHHADRQQFLNAEPLVAAGGAELIEEEALDGAAAGRILSLLQDSDGLATRAQALAALPAAHGGQAAAALIRLME